MNGQINVWFYSTSVEVVVGISSGNVVPSTSSSLSEVIVVEIITSTILLELESKDRSEITK